MRPIKIGRDLMESKMTNVLVRRDVNVGSASSLGLPPVIATLVTSIAIVGAAQVLRSAPGGSATGDIMTRVVEDVNNVERVLIDGIEQGAVAVLQIAVVLGLMFWWSPALALCSLVPVPLLLGGALAYTLTASKRYSAAAAACCSAWPTPCWRFGRRWNASKPPNKKPSPWRFMTR